MITEQCIGFSNTPPLWKKKQFDIQQFEFPSLELHSYQAKEIPGNIRLGHQMEYVFKQLVEHSEAHDIVLHNLPIRQGKRTIGEIDFILKDNKSGKLIHVELTYKFYIIDPEILEPVHQLVGPNRRDAFFTKMEKIKNIQFPLIHTEEGAKALLDIGIDHMKIEHQCCFKAQLFQPHGSNAVNIGTLNKDCMVGYWLRFDDFNKREFASARYYLPSKSEWVIMPNNQVAWKSHSEITVDIKLRHAKENAPMVWQKNSKNEFEKLFIVWW